MKKERLPHRFRHDREPSHARRSSAQRTSPARKSPELLDRRRHYGEQEFAIPFDTQSPFKAGGIRLGTPAVTTRGMKEDEMFDIANLIEEAVDHRANEARVNHIRERVREITARFPLPF